MKNPFSALIPPALFLGAAGLSPAAIITVTETGLAGDAAALISQDFREDAFSYVDRVGTHQHNGAAFNPDTGLLSITGTTIVPLPTYLLGGDYVQFANNARDNTAYSAVVTADTPSTFYVLIDNRANGLNPAVGKTNTTDPTLGGSLQWVLDGGWIRMNTGISPNGQGDYTAIDEGGDGVGPGVLVNNFMSVYKFPTIATSVNVRNTQYNGNNIAVVAVPTAPPPDPIVSFTTSAASVGYGGSVQLSWLISTSATSASIDQGIGDIRPLTDAAGSGTITVTPTVNTTYTLSVNTPTGNATLPISVSVMPLVSYTSTRQRIEAGGSSTLNWSVRPDATVTIDGIGDVTAQTTNGQGSLTVQPTATTDYLLTSTAEGQSVSSTASVLILPPGAPFALIDIGATGGRAEPGAVNGKTIGAAADPVNAVELIPTPLVADTGDIFTLALAPIDPTGNVVGALDWRDRGDAANLPLNRMGEDFVKNNQGMVRATLGQLPAGTYDVISYHTDASNSQSGNIRILVTDALGTATDTTVTGSATWTPPNIAGLTTGKIDAQSARFQITSNGTDDVVIYFDSTADALDKELPLSGLRLTKSGPRPADTIWALIDLGSTTGQPEPGAANSIVIGAADGVNGTNIGPIDLTSRTGVNFQIALDNLDPAGTPIGGLDWRDRGNAPDVPLGWFAEDFVKNNAGLIRVRLTGLPAGAWNIRSYHTDPTLSQSPAIRVLVTDATRTAEDTLLTADASHVGGDGGSPQLNGISSGYMLSKSVLIPVTSNGTDEVILYFDSTLSGGDLETPLNGLRITAATTPGVLTLTNFGRTVSGGTASFSLTFNSQAGKTYTVHASPDPAAWGPALTTTLPATGTSTTFTESGIPLTTTRRFYQVRENQP